MVAALREQGLLRAEEPYTHSVPFSHRSGRADRAADLAAVVLPHGRARGARDRGGRARRGPDHARAATSASTSTGCATSGPGASRASSGGATGSRSGTGPSGEEVVAESEELAREAAAERGLDPDSLSRRPTSSTPGSARRCGRSRPSAGPTRRPACCAPSIRPSLLSTARDIIFLWVARMVMMGIEFAGDVPFRDVYMHPVIQAPDGRRMSKSLGTGIDPLDEIDVHGADALRFGLLAMSSTQDVRYSADRGPAGPRPREQDVERLAADPAQRRRGRAGTADRASRGPLDPLAARARRSSR